MPIAVPPGAATGHLPDPPCTHTRTPHAHERGPPCTHARTPMHARAGHPVADLRDTPALIAGVPVPSHRARRQVHHAPPAPCFPGPGWPQRRERGIPGVGGRGKIIRTVWAISGLDSLPGPAVPRPAEGEPGKTRPG